MTVPAHVRAEFVRLSPVLERALARGVRTHDGEDVWRLIEEERVQFWALPSSVVVTEIAEYPRARVFRVLWAAGRLDDITGAIPEMTAFAERWECSAILVQGRKGWSRVLKNHSFSYLSTSVVKEI